MFTNPLGYVHTRINGRLQAVWDDGTVTPPIICGGDEGEEEKKFSQADVNRLIQERLARAETKPPADYEDLKKKAQRLDELETAGASDLDKANRRISELESENTTLKTSNAGYEEAERRRKIRSQILKAAKDSKDPEAVADLLLKDDDKNAVTIDDAGQVTNAESAVKQLLEDKPYLAGTASAVDNGQGRNRGNGDGKASGLAAGRERYQTLHGSK